MIFSKVNILEEDRESDEMGETASFNVEMSLIYLSQAPIPIHATPFHSPMKLYENSYPLS